MRREAGVQAENQTANDLASAADPIAFVADRRCQSVSPVDIIKLSGVVNRQFGGPGMYTYSALIPDNFFNPAVAKYSYLI